MNGSFSAKVFGIFDTNFNRKRIDDIQASGGEVLRFPKVSVRRTARENALKMVEKLGSFDWVLFSDIFAVDIFIEILEEKEIDLFQLDSLTVCAFGESVADRLRFVQIHSDVIPANRSEDTIYKTMNSYCFTEDKLCKLRMLFLTKAKANHRISDRLRSEVDELVELPIYRFEGVSKTKSTKLKALLAGGAIDEFIFCSVEDVENLMSIVYPDSLKEIFLEIEASATEPNAFQALREYELKPGLKKFQP